MQEMGTVWDSMIIQIVGVVGYCIARILSEEKASLIIKWLNIMGLVFMPLSMITGYISEYVFHFITFLHF